MWQLQYAYRTYSMMTSPPEQNRVFSLSLSRINTPVRMSDQTLPLMRWKTPWFFSSRPKTNKEKTTLEVTDISDLSAAQHQKTNKQGDHCLLAAETHTNTWRCFPPIRSNNVLLQIHREWQEASCGLPQRSRVPLRTRTKHNHTLHMDLRTFSCSRAVRWRIVPRLSRVFSFLVFPGVFVFVHISLDQVAHLHRVDLAALAVTHLTSERTKLRRWTHLSEGPRRAESRLEPTFCTALRRISLYSSLLMSLFW